MLPKLVISDIDGVWTDGGMYYDSFENEWKKFNTSDSAGVVFLKILNIPLAIITGENTEIVQRRIKKLKIDHLYMGVRDKVSIARKICLEMGIELNDVAYIGDDINDIALLRLVGLSATPSNAPEYIQKEVKVTLSKKGGEGVFREFVELILAENEKLAYVIDEYLKSVDALNQ